jgi:DNA-binding transcriptional LysR family regulator
MTPDHRGVLFPSPGLRVARKLCPSALVPSPGRQVQRAPDVTDWADERFPLYAFYPSRRQPAKVRAFLDFVGRICGMEAAPGC